MNDYPFFGGAKIFAQVKKESDVENKFIAANLKAVFLSENEKYFFNKEGIVVKYLTADFFISPLHSQHIRRLCPKCFFFQFLFPSAR